ncbi:hypothetical protein BCI9360_00259 [Bacillus sp. CECT 9360]|nr:hypothetical protein BCI9360_00259 [Bacillus sp. CECT 9360]
MNDVLIETVLQTVCVVGWIGMFIILGFIRLDK